MFKVYFNYGCMKSGKTADLLITAHNNKEKGVPVYILSPKIDTRNGEGVISTRIGISAKADFILDKYDKGLHDFITKVYNEDGMIIIDECQFVDPITIHSMCKYCRDLDFGNTRRKNNFSIIAYGLLTDYRSSLFDGTIAWLDEADSINKIKFSCAYCSRQATRNLLTNKVDQDGNVLIGDNEYKPVCSYHYWKYNNNF